MPKVRELPNRKRKEAISLARLNYCIRLTENILEDGTTVYFAENPELPGCISDGITSKDAIENLRDARIDYIQVLLLSKSRVPLPTHNDTDLSVTKIYIDDHISSSDKSDKIDISFIPLIPAEV